MTAVTERAERGTALLDERSCEAGRDFAVIKVSCREPAIGQFRRACVHEHVRDGWLCSYHAETSGHRLCCLACLNLPGGLSHECPISLAEVTA